MYAKSLEHKAERIEKVIAHCREKLPKRELAGVEDFVRTYCDRIAAEDALEFSVENLYGLTLGLWKFAASRDPANAKVRVFNPRIDQHGWKSPHTVVEVVNDDMPFLVDSVTSALTGDGHTVHLLIHPILQVRRDAAGKRCAPDKTGDTIAESVLHIEIDEQSDDGVLGAIERKIAEALADVRIAVNDWRAMLGKIDETLDELNRSRPPLEDEEIEEGRALLEWMANDHFTFLGYREYAYEETDGAAALNMIEDSGLGLMRDPAKRVLRPAGSGSTMSPEVQDFLRKPELVIVTKAGTRSTVHRPVYLDYVGIKRFDEAGKVDGERRFIGLFTSAAYNQSPREIPYLRRKLWRTLKRSDMAPSSHDGKALINIVENYPRDELFQISEDELLHTVTGILGLEERPRLRLFVRRDKFERFLSSLVYVPRERYSTDLRQKFEEILRTSYNGRISAFYTQIGDHPLARIHFIIGTDPGSSRDADVHEVEAKMVAAAQSWDDNLFAALIDRWGEEAGNRLWRNYERSFPVAYKEDFNAAMALFDIDKIECVADSGEVALNFYRLIEDDDDVAHLKIYHPGAPVALSDCLPMIEHMGLKVMEEHPYEIGQNGDDPICWMHDFRLTHPTGGTFDLARVKDKFEAAFAEVWRGEMEDDGFNRLVLRAGLDSRQVVVLRAYCKYLRQTGIAFSQDYMEDTLAANPAISRLICELFATMFDPDQEADRTERADRLASKILEALDQVSSLDQDRILRRFLNLIQNTLRTNFYQPAADGRPKPYLSLKLDSLRVDELPLPRPFREIFVYSPRFEGIHLRGGRVARGGLRWSDRREDFRTEVLGLMKAQMVKNAVIVPVGSKGGFVPKRLPTDGDREAWLQEGIACYKIFISGLLDITDNLVGDDRIAPTNVIRRDGWAPYLVVAADKGTASFSDIANSVAEDYGFWLGDAFASGGAAGYDHKKMAITARGAWESVKRHFRETGHDIQNEDFTVIGCGDMSGDVFGNGMLLSKHIKLVAAFDHRNIFIDPDPDPAASWTERHRLFGLARSSWEDYERGLISKGGGVFNRRAKSIAISAEMKRLFEISEDRLVPSDLLRAMLRADVDLLWFGGIGTYVKASDERQADAGDRTNDALRVDGSELRARVIGEGANLGLTQRGRIEFSLAGGRLNSDFIDNSAGVDCSDHEVNIKILLNAVVADGEMTRKQRDRLLAEMTDEVGLMVLHDNYLQTQALTMAESQGPAAVNTSSRFMRNLERAGRLNREVEFLPDDEVLAERQSAGRGLSRPENSVLIAYAKMELYDALLDSEVPDQPHLANDLIKYFPRPLRNRFRDVIPRHRLHREIIATILANAVVNRGGITFVHDLQEDTDAATDEIARAFVVARETFDMRPVWIGIQQLDNKVPAATQVQMNLMTQELLHRAARWFLRNSAAPLEIVATVQDFAAGIARLRDGIETMLGELEAASLAKRTESLIEQGVPPALAGRVAVMEPLGSALDIVQAAKDGNREVDEVGRVYFSIGDRFGLDWLRAQSEQVAPESNWERMAISSIVDDLFSQQRALTNSVLLGADGAGPQAAVDGWIDQHPVGMARIKQLNADIRGSGGIDIAKLAIANRHVRRLIID